MDLETRAEGLMSEVSDLVKRTNQIKGESREEQPEVLSNLALAVRHLEDAQSRIERAWVLMGTAEKDSAC